MRLGIAFDLRNPEPWRKPWREHYEATLELIEEAERLGIDAINVAEHHGWEDGYSPQPLAFLAAAAARTSTIALTTGVLLAPLHKSAEIAEQAAVVDGISGGRLELALGAGYSIPEFELYDVSISRRYKLIEQRVVEVRELWASGRATPVPEAGEVPIWLGVFGPRGCEIAGRLGCGLYAVVDPANWQIYLDALEAAGHPAETRRAGTGLFAVLSDDPARDLPLLAERIKHSGDAYLKAAAGVEVPGKDNKLAAPSVDIEPLLNGDALLNVDGHNLYTGAWARYGVLTPDQAVDEILALGEGRLEDIDLINFMTLPCGVIDDITRRSVELVATELRPRLDAALRERGVDPTPARSATK